MNNLACAMAGVKGEKVALCDVSVSAVLRDLLSEVTVSQTYRNDESVNIEAVYTFPLPLDAVLLDLEVEIGNKVLKAVVVEKKAAEERYEDAVAEGDAAVMLEVLEPGLYTVNVGNLLPGEKASIKFKYAVLYRWAGDRLRFFIPTTIAPRYGESPHLPHQAPESSLTVENQFSLRVEVFGALRDAQFLCPTHTVTLTKSADKVDIALQQERVAMDRDFVLQVKAPQATRSFVQCDADGKGLAAMASFQPFFPGLQQPRPLNLAIVIDCSGSMKGDSMEQAKRALEGILDALQPHDRVTLIAFGSTINALSDRLLPCNKTNLAKAKNFAKQLDANMGGTEIEGALRRAYAALEESKSADIFLVTDGEVSSWEQVAREAASTGHRIFTVGVGNAVSEAFVRGLAAGTGGECELVSPREEMSERVIRHFERMRAPRAKRVAIHWPEGARNPAPSKPGAVFEGDTLVAYARFESPSVHGPVTLEIETETGEVVRQELPIVAPAQRELTESLSTVARLAASARLKELDGVPALETALHYRLVSPWTNWLVIAVRPEDEKASDIPELRKVPQTLAAGWGGAGSAEFSLCDAELVSYSPVRTLLATDYSEDAGDLELSIPSFLRLGGSPASLAELIEKSPSRIRPDNALDLLVEAGLPDAVADIFQRATDLGIRVEVIAAIVLAAMLKGSLGEVLPAEAQDMAKSLQDYAKRATKVLKGLMRSRRLVDNSVLHDVLQPDQAHALEFAFMPFSGYRDFYDQLLTVTESLSS